MSTLTALPAPRWARNIHDRGIDRDTIYTHLAQLGIDDCGYLTDTGHIDPAARQATAHHIAALAGIRLPRGEEIGLCCECGTLTAGCYLTEGDDGGLRCDDGDDDCHQQYQRAYGDPIPCAA